MISVIIPVYNGVPHLQECLRAVLAQDHSDFEVLCVDDGSTDMSWEILEDAAEREPRLRIVHQTNQGASAARNRGLDMARGELITFVDADDLVEPRMLSVLESALTAYGADIAVGHKWVEKGGGLKPRPQKLPAGPVDASRRSALQGLLGMVAPHAKLFRKLFLEEHQLGFREGITYEDHVHWVRTLAAAPQVVVCEEFLYTYRRLPGSVSAAERRLEPFHLCSRLTAFEESLHAARQSGIVGLTAMVYRRHLRHSVLRHLWALPDARDRAHAQTVRETLRDGLLPHRRAVDTVVDGWRYLLYALLLDGDLEDLVRACRFVRGEERLMTVAGSRRAGERTGLCIRRRIFPSLPDWRYPELFDIGDIMVEKATRKAKTVDASAPQVRVGT